MPALLFQIALIIIIVRSVFMVFQHAQKSRKEWLELLYYIAVAVAALSFLL
ncbi:hypothetical protein ACFFK0_11435 [Paenibacillus chartarius]|uniref:Uncharacterized protein n=1 Tax=Paenibacillus chartarius TaxID=747481 RepID=A0ABV6DK99_9BACL